MPCKCCVPECRGNYDLLNKVAVFGFPKEEALKAKWLQAIPRKDFTVSKNSKVCERHFRKEEILLRTEVYIEKTGETISAPLKKPKLKEDAVPSIFLGCPLYYTKTSAVRESPSKKRQRIEEEQIKVAMHESLTTKQIYDDKTHFTSFEELQKCLRDHSFSTYWSILEKNDTVIFMDLVIKDDIPLVKYALTVNKNLDLNVSLFGEKVSKHKQITLPIKINSINQIFEILDCYENNQNVKMSESFFDIVESVIQKASDLFTDKQKHVFVFFCEQFKLLKCKPERYRYSTDILVFSSILFYISPQAYKFLRNSQYIILPDPSTIRRIGSILKNSPLAESNNFLGYAKHAIHSLKDDDLTVFLLIDEIHIKPFLDYKGGNIVGMAYNGTSLATSVHVFMIQSLFSPFKDVVHIVPIDSFDASKLFNLMFKVIMGLEKIGFKVMGMITDNNSINRSAASHFSNPPSIQVQYSHPADNSRPLFYLIDSVHILKCVRNNWLNNYKNGFYFYYPDFDCLNNISTASLTSVRKLYDLESCNILKFGYGLTRKALWPTNLERQNVKLALKLFNTDIVHALNELGEKHNLEAYLQTSKFINVICTWWDVVNVKTPNKGKFKNNPMCEPITSNLSDERLIFLKKIVSWVSTWEKMNSNNGRLSKETFFALRHTTQCFIDIVEYCCNILKKQYVLLGKIQTDKLESRFGQYRSLSGDQYHISVRQIYETECKLRLCHELKLMSHKKGSITVNLFDKNCINKENSDKCEDRQVVVDLVFCDISVEDSDIASVADTLPVIIYLAGYCSHAAFKKTKCLHCRDKLIQDKDTISDNNHKLIEVNDRGGLLYPSDLTVNAVLHTYIVVQKIISEKYENDFLKVSNQHNLIINIVEHILVSKDEFLSFDMCEDGHAILPSIILILKSATNSLLNNYCKVKNDEQKVRKKPSIYVAPKCKRKIETYTKNSLTKNGEPSQK